jgi:hypothetical protein
VGGRELAAESVQLTRGSREGREGATLTRFASDTLDGHVAFKNGSLAWPTLELISRGNED